MIARTDINIRASRYFIAHTVGTCPQCRAPTRLLALALPRGHETLEPDDGRGPATEDAWHAAARGAFLFHVDHVSAAVHRRLYALMPSYRLPSGEALDSCWANHCERCDATLDDHELFCEPDGAFLPTSEASAAAIRLCAVDEALEAFAAGYAYDPLFFDAMVRD